jgi:hypothetical protein
MLSRAAIGFALAASAAFVASYASAQDFMGAQTPSHNIFCQASPPDQDQPTPQLRCDIQQVTSRPPPAPRNCPLSWGDAFVIDPTGPGRLLCHGDTVQNPDDAVIAYGEQWRAYGFTCTSQTTGLTCVNGQGHGFSLSRAVQKVF